MSRPRPVLPQKIYLVTRRCTQRRFLLQPDCAVTQVFLYCLAVAATKYSVQIHAICVMSNHYHLVVTDRLGNLPEFMHWLNGTVARCLNSHMGRWENFWAPGTYSRVELVGEEDVLAKIIYTLANPVAAGLVAWGHEWPGIRAALLRNAPRRLLARRPDFFFRKEENRSLPEEAELVLEKPYVFSQVSDDEFASVLAQNLEEREEAIRRDFRTEGRPFRGRKAVLAQPREESPGSREPRRNLDPQVASGEKGQRTEALQKFRSFLEEYRAALREYCRGVRDVLFPAGTYWMRIHHGVSCRPAPSPAPG